MSDSQRRFDWTLEPEAFGRFLVLLDADIGAAANKYERLRHKLVRLFEWRGCDFSEDLADQTLDRVIRKLQQGLNIEGDDLMRYAAGVARHVAHEYWRHRRREQVGRGDAERPPFVPGRHSTTDFRLAHLEECLERLPSVDREIILRYYPALRSERISARKLLAEELGLRANTLRIRAYRIRAKLLDLVQESLAEAAESPAAAAPSSPGVRAGEGGAG